MASDKICPAHATASTHAHWQPSLYDLVMKYVIFMCLPFCVDKICSSFHILKKKKMCSAGRNQVAPTFYFTPSRPCTRYMEHALVEVGGGGGVFDLLS